MIPPRIAIIAGLGAALVLSIIIGVWLVTRTTDKAVEASHEAGATQQRETNLQEVIKRTEQGNEARDQIRNDSDNARYNLCLQSARTPANCDRYLLP